jgi:hypothetical protein
MMWRGLVGSVPFIVGLQKLFEVSAASGTGFLIDCVNSRRTKLVPLIKSKVVASLVLNLRFAFVIPLSIEFTQLSLAVVGMELEQVAPIQ